MIGRLASAMVLAALLAGCARRTPPAPQGGSAASGSASARRIEVSPGVVLDRACTPAGPERCFDARDDNCNGVIDEGCGIPTGLVQFMIAWNDEGADVDLDVTDPNGELVEVAQPNRAGLVKDRDCPGRAGECRGQNFENVYLGEGAELLRGTYRVRLRLERLGSEEPPVQVRLGARVGPRSYAAAIGLKQPDDAAEILFEL
jgi:hypothetical protein